VLFVLVGIAAFWFFLALYTKWRFFEIFPPLVVSYATPVVCSNTGLIPSSSPVYEQMDTFVLPLLIVLFLLDVDLMVIYRTLGRGVAVMLSGTAGVVIGGPIAYAIVSPWLDAEAWRGFGPIAGSWIGGSQNMAAVASGLQTSERHFGLSILADNVIYIIWIPLLLQVKTFAPWFNRFTRATERPQIIHAHAPEEDTRPLETQHVLYLLALGLSAAYAARLVAGLIPEVPPVLSQRTYEILLVTTMGIGLSFSPARRLPSARSLALALAYLFMAQMGARASLSEMASLAIPFVAGALIWVSIHGACIVVAARLMHVDIGTAAVASAANIGGTASGPVVAAYHDERLIPAAILMALLGNAVGNYAAFFCAYLCSLVA
jgi:uncharacterized membrane protein